MKVIYRGQLSFKKLDTCFTLYAEQNIICLGKLKQKHQNFRYQQASFHKLKENRFRGYVGERSRNDG